MAPPASLSIGVGQCSVITVGNGHVGEATAEEDALKQSDQLEAPYSFRQQHQYVNSAPTKVCGKRGRPCTTQK